METCKNCEYRIFSDIDGQPECYLNGCDATDSDWCPLWVANDKNSVRISSGCLPRMDTKMDKRLPVETTKKGNT